MNTDELDVIDQAILYQLQRDGRKSITDIASAVDVSDNTVRNRISEMEASGVIESYTVNVNYDRAGVQHHYLFVCTVRVRDRERLAAEARKLPGVVGVTTLMTGTQNVYLVAAGAEKDDITDLAYDVDDLGLSIEREHLVRDSLTKPYSGFEPPEHLSSN